MPRKRKPDDHGLHSRIRTVQVLLVINACIWAWLGTSTVLSMLSHNTFMVSLLAGTFLYISAASMLVAARYLGRQASWAYYFSLGVVVFNMLISLLNQFGLADTLTLFYDLVLIGLLISLVRVHLKSA